MNITIENVSHTYGDVVALDGLSLEIPSGETFGVLGTNGAGKTTLFELLVGHDSPDRGTITVGGIDTSEAGYRVRERVGFMPERVGFPGLLTGREILETHARIRGVGPTAQDRIDAILETVGLTAAADRRVEGYSNGMQSRLGLAAALLSRPPVLVLDEPTAGLDPQGVDAFHRMIERIKHDTGATIVLSSHVLSEIERLCESVAILADGQLRATGTVAELTSGASDLVTITVWPVDASDRGQLRDIGDRAGATETFERHLEIACPRDQVFDTLDQLPRERIDRIEITEPGLDAAFRDVIADGHPQGQEVQS